MQSTQNAQESVVDKYKKLKRLKKIYSLLGTSGILTLGVAILSLVVLIGVFGGGDSKSTSGSGSISGVASVQNLPPEVLRWKDMVEKECAAQGVPELVPYVLAIIMVESNGISEKLPDIMQSSESQGWNMNTISNPKDSIYYGVMHLKGAFDDAKMLGINDLLAIVQTYNFGRNYVHWLAANNKTHSLETADNYSLTVVAPAGGNKNGTRIGYSQAVAVAYNGGYRYINGGNFFYGEMVKQYLSFDNGTAPVNGSETFKAMMNEVLKFNGGPYVWGGKSATQGFDCSGLTYWAYKSAGITIPISAATQYDFTVAVDPKDAQPGDLVFFRGTYGGPNHVSHVGIYVDANTMYDSNSSGIGHHQFTSSYWQQHFAGIRRVPR
ncbi:bifunctional lysozyme/C40 family peptidase [Bacillus thuringiensis]|uniref:bifunctional lytic transglycosylase/C40 family peptidase n=1 Tax=Bacillus thuringiensis TaxID=1428 RepID=UPI002DBCBD65|nr:bifunctional lysozyme/C40 family peptidase [Bacillus thuringiensis]MEC3226128.1 bifunctional lysozyme/C40 family peptidase [Bacillus thuringiensis]MEC3463210.1 bifunctional lysozyme/C40 family peptidase [Bacillus thuringiensis]MEC3556330.1 bifunctional lysozyme/C40 family peptidase [Bacillus thuringiensis]MED2058894.1 bifunctional lysozyme/C40 family peptidase [Bacillus thuringiensis]